MTATGGIDPGVRHFTTSGTTGAPVAWTRTSSQVDAEAALLTDLLGLAGRSGEVGQILSFAPRRHLFGHLFGQAIPDLLGVPVTVADDHRSLPMLSGTGSLLVATVPSGWHLLHRMRRVLARFDRVTVVHSTGPLPAAEVVDPVLDVPGLRAVELFGSTETGGIAWRTVGTGDRWRLLDDVQFACESTDGAVCALDVHSPRLAHRVDQPVAHRHRTGDRVRIRGPRHFEFLGREDRTIKVNGRRCDLSTLEHRLAAHGIVATAQPRTDPLRGASYDLQLHSAELSVSEIWRRLPAALDGLPTPRRIDPAEPASDAVTTREDRHAHRD